MWVMLKILSAPLSKQSVIKSKEVVMCCYVCYLLFDLISAYTALLPADFTLIIRTKQKLSSFYIKLGKYIED